MLVSRSEILVHLFMDKEYKEEAQCAQKGGRMPVFVICGFIKKFLTNYYFILHIHHAKSFKMRHVRPLYFNFSVRYSSKCFKKVLWLRLLSNYYPDKFLLFVALLRIFYQIPISYCKFIMSKALKWHKLRLCTLFIQ